VFLGSGGSSDISKKGSDGSSSSSSDYDSEVDEANDENGNGFSYIMNGRVTELEEELQEARQHIEALEEKTRHCQCEKLEESLRQVRSEKEDLVAAVLANKNEVEDLKGDLAKVTGEKLQLEAQVKELEQVSQSLDESSEEIMKLQEIIKDLQARLENDANEKGVLEERAMEFEQVCRQLEDSRTEVMELQATIKKLKDDLGINLQEKALLQDRVKDLEQATSDLNASVASLEGKLTATEEQLKQLHAEKEEASLRSAEQISELNETIADLKNKLELLSSEKSAIDNKMSVLLFDITTRDEKLKEMDSHLHQLHLEHVKLLEDADVARKTVSDLRARVCELEEEVEKQKLLISDSAEGKREAIRQLCFSLDHYRHGYEQLRQLLQGHRRPMVMAT
jgi:chromosome segregation ATPase